MTSTLRRLATRLTTPLLPDDYLTLLNPLWSTRELRARVLEVLPEAAGATTLVLRPGSAWTGHVAGQHVRVGVEINGVRHTRSYSLTSPPRPDGTITICVKAVPDGSVSRQLAQRTRVGDVLQLSQAAGDFVLPETPTRGLLLITAGSGVTPVMGMLRSLSASPNASLSASPNASLATIDDVVMLHSALTRDEVIFGAELRQLSATHAGFRLIERHTETDGMLDLDRLDEQVPDWRERETWVCGPAGLLDAAERVWAQAGVGPLLHVERFRPKVLADTGAAAGTVAFSRTGRESDSAGTLLETGEQAGVLMPSGCRMGICHGCVLPLLRGQVRDTRTGEVHGTEGELVQTCVSTACGDVELDV